MTPNRSAACPRSWPPWRVARAAVTLEGPARFTAETGTPTNFGATSPGVIESSSDVREPNDEFEPAHLASEGRIDAGSAAAAIAPLAGWLAAGRKSGVQAIHDTDGLNSGKVKSTPPDETVDPEGPGRPGGYRYTVGKPTRPPIAFDDDFVFDPTTEASVSDYVSWNEWGAKLLGAPLLRSDLDDSLELYAHYRDGSGRPMRVDYEEVYREAEMIRDAVDSEIAVAMRWAELLHRETGLTEFAISGDAVQPRSYPGTENWQKPLGGHTIWGSGDVWIEGNTVTMEVTIHAEDRYNFNRGEADIATGTPDDENGRFAELGWARSFDVSGSVTRTVTWELGSELPPSWRAGMSTASRRVRTASTEGAVVSDPVVEDHQ